MPVTVTIDAPESITLSRLTDWLADLGIPVEGVRQVVIERGGISLELTAHGVEGLPFTVGTGDDMRAASHTVVIPVTDD